MPIIRRILYLMPVISMLGCGDPQDVGETSGTGDPPAVTCGHGETPNATGDACCFAGSLPIADGSCLPAGIQEDGCPAGEVVVDFGTIAGGTCRPAGIPPEMCGEGFVNDGNGGCNAVLPEEDCPKGLMAVPGETKCREVAPCGEGKWGDIPLEPSTQFVDASYGGELGESDGSEQRPWTEVQHGIDAAEPGAIVAVAPGSYDGSIKINYGDVRLWGKCPSEVEIVGTGGEPAALIIGKNADHTEVHNIALRGPKLGLVLSGSEHVEVDRVWIHETGDVGLLAENTWGPTELSLSASLIEEAHTSAVLVTGAIATIEGSVMRLTQPDVATGKLGRGITIQEHHENGGWSDVEIHATLVDKNHDEGIFVSGSDVRIEGSLIRDTQPRALDGASGRGLSVQESDDGRRSDVDIVASNIERNHEIGLHVSDSELWAKALVIRDTQSQPSEEPNQGDGRGLNVQDGVEPAVVTILSSVIERSSHAGIVTSGSVLTVIASIVRGNSDIGLAAQFREESGLPAYATVTSCVLEANDGISVFAEGSYITLNGTTVRNTLPSPEDQTLGRGVHVQMDRTAGERGDAEILHSVVTGSFEFGVVVLDSSAWIDATVVRDGLNDDAIAVVSEMSQSEAIVLHSLVADNGRAGLSSFGGTILVGQTKLECNDPNMNEVPWNGFASTLDKLGANVCEKCDSSHQDCQPDNLELDPPSPVEY